MVIQNTNDILVKKQGTKAGEFVFPVKFSTGIMCDFICG